MNPSLKKSPRMGRLERAISKFANQVCLPNEWRHSKIVSAMRHLVRLERARALREASRVILAGRDCNLLSELSDRVLALTDTKARKRKSMKLEDQVCSLELAKRLKELGVKQESYFRWCRVAELDGGEESLSTHWELDKRDGALAMTVEHEAAATFTVAELGEMLPRGFRTARALDADKWAAISYGMEDPHFCVEHGTESETEADARAKMLIRLIENNLIDFNGLITTWTGNLQKVKP